MKLRVSLLSGLFLVAASLHAETVRVLFLGNSFTARNNLSGLVRAMAAAGQPAARMEATAITYGGQTMQYHWSLFSQNWVNLPALTEAELDQSLADLKAQLAKDPANGNARRAIERHEGLRAALGQPWPKWDYVVLQSWKDTEGGLNSPYVASARRLATLAREQGTKVIFYDPAPDALNAAPLTAAIPRARRGTRPRAEDAGHRIRRPRRTDAARGLALPDGAPRSAAALREGFPPEPDDELPHRRDDLHDDLRAQPRRARRQRSDRQQGF